MLLKCPYCSKPCSECDRLETDCPIKNVKDVDHHIGGWVINTTKKESKQHGENIS